MRALIILLFPFLLLGQSNLRKDKIVTGNKVTVQLWNYGSYSSPGNRTTDFRWEGLGYTYEVGFLVGAKVEVPEDSHADVFEEDGNWYAHIISDGLISVDGEVSPDFTERWGWKPFRETDGRVYFEESEANLPGSADWDHNLDGIPDSWPVAWNGIWPGKWIEGEALGDSEVLYGMNDRNNHEFEYFPFPQDSSIGGLGLEVEVRTVQLQDFYDDIVFAVFEIKNNSEKDLRDVVVGLWGDPHIGGADDWRDDLIGYSKENDLVYAWDADGVGEGGLTPGYFGFSFLQSPGNSNDGIDNDGDGLIDESPWNNIDDDNDWSAESDDLGTDGLPGTGDEGENDGLPTRGEPNFEWTDIDETDMLGLTSFMAPFFGQMQISDDEKVYSEIYYPGNFAGQTEPGDYVMTAGSGHFDLPAQASVQIGVAFVFGEDIQDLFTNNERAARLYRSYIGGLKHNLSYSVVKPDSGEVSADNLTVDIDDSNLPQDANVEFALSKANSPKWLAVGTDKQSAQPQYQIDVSDLPSSAFYTLRSRVMSPTGFGSHNSSGFFTIDNSGDENVPAEVLPLFNKNITLSGTYRFSWLSADVDGDDFQTSLIITSSLVSDTLYPLGNFFDVNTRNYPNADYKLSFVSDDGKEVATYDISFNISNNYDTLEPSLLHHPHGYSNSAVYINIVDQSQLSGHLYKIVFDTLSPASECYSVFDSTAGEWLIENEPFYTHPHTGSLFDGIRLSFENEGFSLNEEASGWSESSVSALQYNFTERDSAKFYPADYEFRFMEAYSDTSVNGIAMNFRTWNVTLQKESYVHISEKPATRNGRWDPDEDIFVFENIQDPDNAPAAKAVWQVHIGSSDSDQNPNAGDLLRLVTHKPLRQDDVYIFDTAPLSIDDESNQPLGFELFQNFPNPFNGETIIRFSLSAASKVELEIFNILGQKVYAIGTGNLSAGTHAITWPGRTNGGADLASGIYFYRLKTSTELSNPRKMMLIK